MIFGKYRIDSVLAFNEKLKKYFGDSYGTETISDIVLMRQMLEEFSQIGKLIGVDFGTSHFNYFKRVEMDGFTNLEFLRIVRYEYRIFNKIKREDLFIKPTGMVLSYRAFLDENYIALQNAEINLDLEKLSKLEKISIINTAEPVIFHPRGSLYDREEIAKRRLIEKLKC